MSGTKKDRQSLKDRFKKGMYPTEDDFADVFESYVHKDDTIPLSKVVVEEGGESVSETINSKADKKSLENLIKDFDTALETVRDTETGEITKTAIQDLSKRIEDAETDIDKATNKAKENGDAVAKILTILGKQDGETVSELAERFLALSGSYATVYAFVSKVKAFLESADASDETINRWTEIESFLQGITDSQNLTGMLVKLKDEILQSVPKGNFLEQIEDLDAYTDAPDGKIVQYIGQTNDKYTRCFTYERKCGDNIKIGDYYIAMKSVDTDYTSGLTNDFEKFKTAVLGKNFVDKGNVIECWFYGYPETIIIGEPKVGSLRLNLNNGYITTVNSVEASTIEGKIRINESELWEKKLINIYEAGDGTKIILYPKIKFGNYGLDTPPYRFNNELGCVYLYEGVNTKNRATHVQCTFYQARESIISGVWQHIPNDMVIY